MIVDGIKNKGWLLYGQSARAAAENDKPAGDLHHSKPLSPREVDSAHSSASTSLAPKAALKTQVSTFEHWQKRSKENTVSAGTYSMTRVGRELARVVGTGLQAAVGAVGAAGATAVLAGSVSGKNSDGSSKAVDAQVLALAAGPALATAATTLLGGIVGAVGKGYLTKPEAMKETFKKYVKDSSEDLKKMPEDVKKPISIIDMVLERLCTQVSKGEDVDTARFERLLKWRQEFLMAITREPKVVPAWTTREGRAELKAKIRASVETFPPEVRKDLASVIRRIAANSVTIEGQKHRRLQFRFKGPGGTGKDTFMKILEATLGVPVIELVVPPERDGGVEGLLGKPWEAIEQSYYAPSNEELFGALGLALIKSGYSNAIIYLNEIKFDEPGVVNGLKRLLDPAKDSIEFKSLGTKIDMSNHTFFVASNDDINPDAALESRWETIALTHATRETKQHAALELYEQEAKNYKNPLKDGHSILTLDQQEEMDDLFRDVLPMLLDEHEKKLPGARMDFVRSVATFIADKLEDQQTDRSDQPESSTTKSFNLRSETEKFIVDHYQKISIPESKDPDSADKDSAKEKVASGNKLITDYYPKVPATLKTYARKRKAPTEDSGDQRATKIASSKGLTKA